MAHMPYNEICSDDMLETRTIKNSICVGRGGYREAEAVTEKTVGQDTVDKKEDSKSKKKTGYGNCRVC